MFFQLKHFHMDSVSLLIAVDRGCVGLLLTVHLETFDFKLWFELVAGKRR